MKIHSVFLKLEEEGRKQEGNGVLKKKKDRKKNVSVAAAAAVSYSIWQRPAPTATALSVRLAPLRKCPLAASGFLR